nr:hypothetical protein BgiMline_016569 [Biomphalaria glabrata]
MTGEVGGARRRESPGIGHPETSDAPARYKGVGSASYAFIESMFCVALAHSDHVVAKTAPSRLLTLSIGNTT